MKTLAIDSLDDLPDAAEAVIDALAGRTVVAFRGEMGAGKTTLIGAILDRLGSADTVTSPTFALVNQYDTAGGRPVFHFDFYRIDRIEEAYDFGYEEYFYSGNLCLVEWPEKIEELLPDDTRGRPRAAHAVHRLRRPDEPAGRRTVAVRAVSFAPQGSDARFLHEADHQRKRIDHHAVHHGDQRHLEPVQQQPDRRPLADLGDDTGRLKQPRKLPKAACDQRQQADFTHPRGGFPRREKETDQLDGEQRHRARTACNEKIEHNARIFKVQQFGESPLQR